ncbi:MAG: hypothetical protein LBH98_09195 [Chitinispirillales bacterium]|jgi:hypothetical protein|nr:hypothetical protein [Chitinispirillales bacterium]
MELSTELDGKPTDGFFSSRYGVAGKSAILSKVNEEIRQVKEYVEKELEKNMERLKLIPEKTEEREKEIVKAIDLLYDTALNKYEQAKQKIIRAWDKVEADRSYLDQLGFGDILDMAKEMLREYKKNLAEIGVKEKEYGDKIEEENNNLSKKIKDLKTKNNFNEKLDQLKGDRDSFKQYDNEIKSNRIKKGSNNE